MDTLKRAHLAEPRGFCTGVKAAIEAVEKALAEGPHPVCVLHEIVHNEHVVAALAKRGVRFIEQPSDAPRGATLIFSAHGVSKAVEDAARALPVKIVDATCPLVKKLQSKAMELEAQGLELILIGHKDHKELEGVLGRLSRKAHVILNETELAALGPMDSGCACLTQTTLSAGDVAKLVGKLKEKYPSIVVGGGVCYATKDRQDAVKRLCETCDTVIVVGSRKSSNSKRLKEVAEAAGARALLVDSAQAIPLEILDGAKDIGITAGASAPESLVEEVVRLLERHGYPMR